METTANPTKDAEQFPSRMETATVEDWEAYKQLRLLAHTGNDADKFFISPEDLEKEKTMDEEGWRKELSHPDLIVTLAWNGAEAIGMVQDKKTEGEGVWKCGTFFMKPEFRNATTSLEMFAENIRAVIKKGGKKIMAGTKVGNKGAMRLFKHFGFVETELINDPEFPRQEMALDLTDQKVISRIEKKTTDPISLEKFTPRIGIAEEKDWEAYKAMRLDAMTGKDAEMFSATPERVAQEKAKTDDEWRGDLLRKDYFVGLAWNGKEPIGMNRAIEHVAEEGPGVWGIYTVYVRSDFQDKHVGRKIYATCLNEIQRRGGKKAILYIVPSNERSFHVAEKFGFRKVDQPPEPGSGSIKMELDLSIPKDFSQFLKED